jgi:hypothetical protein
MMKKVLLVCFYFIGLTNLSSQVIIEGYFKGQNSIGINAFVRSEEYKTGLGTVSYTDGHFRFLIPKGGVYELNFSFIGTENIKESMVFEDNAKYNFSIILKSKNSKFSYEKSPLSNEEMIEIRNLYQKVKTDTETSYNSGQTIISDEAILFGAAIVTGKLIWEGIKWLGQNSAGSGTYSGSHSTSSHDPSYSSLELDEPENDSSPSLKVLSITFTSRDMTGFGEYWVECIVKFNRKVVDRGFYLPVEDEVIIYYHKKQEKFYTNCDRLLSELIGFNEEDVEEWALEKFSK